MVQYVERHTIPIKDKQEIIREVYETEGLKPWTLMSRVEASRESLHAMLLQEELYINATGDIITPP